MGMGRHDLQDTGIAPHGLFEVWSPDQVAECLEGVGEDLYRKLWTLVRHYDGKPRSEVNDDFADRCLARWWSEVGDEDRETLNRLAEAEDARWR